MTAMIVDDSPYESGQLRSILTRLGVTVLGEYEDGISALAAIRARKPDWVTLDMQLPGMHGLEIARLLKGSKTRVIMCSGTKQKAIQEQATAAGAVTFVVKPYDEILITAQLRSLFDDG